MVRHEKEQINYNGCMNKRNQYATKFKTKVVLEVLRDEETVNEVASQYGINLVMLSRWKIEFLGRVAEVFKKGPSAVEKELLKPDEKVQLSNMLSISKPLRQAYALKEEFYEVLRSKNYEEMTQCWRTWHEHVVAATCHPSTAL